MTVDKDTKHQERLDLTQIKIQFLGGVSMPHIAFNYATTTKKKKKNMHFQATGSKSFGININN